MKDPGTQPTSSDAAQRAREAAVRQLRTVTRTPDPVEEPTRPIPIDPATNGHSEPVPAAGDGDGGRTRIVGPLEAVLRHPLLALIPLVLLVAGGAYLASARTPEYTAKARVNVGRADIPAYVLQNASYGNQVVAASYARSIDAAPVVQAAAQQTGLPVGTARDRLSATTIPDSTLIQVEATGPSSNDASGLANAGARSLIAYLKRITRSDEGARALRRYRDAQAVLRRLELRLDRLRRSNANARRVARAQLAVDAAGLEASQYANLYRQAETAEGSSSAPLTLLAPAAKADSDRRSVLEQTIVIALAAGLVLGVGLALLAANWRTLRALRE
ncbi:MAG TPA: hypothetical protein VF712_04775 [Thermoleophilaceae bacterium]|jgi:hypothetical protein